MFVIFDGFIFLGVFAIGACLLAGLWLARLAMGRECFPRAAGIRAAARRAARHGNAACGRCGQDVPAWDTANPLATACPECGGAYARVGVVTPAAAARLGPPLWLSGGLLAFPTVFAAIVAFLWAYATFVPPPPGFQQGPSTRSGGFTVEPSRDRPPDPLAYMLIFNVTAIGTPQSGSPPTFQAVGGSIGVMASGPNIPQLSLDHDFATNAWTLTEMAGSPHPVLERGTGAKAGIDAIFRHAGLDQRRFADAERHEARGYTDILTGTSRPPNGFLATGHASEARHANDFALSVTRASMQNSGGGLQMAAAPSVPSHAVPVALLAGLVPILLWGLGVAMLWRARRRVLAA
jgi:hypothetical protein